MGKIQITTKGISKFLKAYTEEKAISEYIWDGFDAEADIINVITTVNKMDRVEKVEIVDNGTGIEFEKLSSKFMPFYQSEKSISNNSVKYSKVHGKNGLGRLTFFCLANNAKWETIYKTQKGNIKYEIDINSRELENYDAKNRLETQEDTGTKVTLYNINKIIDIEYLRRNINNGKIENIVVELKHPTNVRLGKKHLDQVITYMDTILQEKRFNNNEQWNFYLVGTEFDTSGYIERCMKNVKEKNEKSLVWEVDNYKIYVKKWSEIFSDFELKHNFLQEKLQLQKDKLLEKEKYNKADDIVDESMNNSACRGYDKKLKAII